MTAVQAAAGPPSPPWFWAIAGMRRALALGAFLALAAFILGPLLTLLLWAFRSLRPFSRGADRGALPRMR